MIHEHEEIAQWQWRVITGKASSARALTGAMDELDAGLHLRVPAVADGRCVRARC